MGLTRLGVYLTILLTLSATACAGGPTPASPSGAAPPTQAPPAAAPASSPAAAQAASPAASPATQAAGVPKVSAPAYKRPPDDLVAAARKEGKVRFTSALEPREVKSLIDAFKAAYPGIEPEYNRTGVGEDEKILLAMRAGTFEWDLLSIQSEVYPSYRDANAVVSYGWNGTFGTEPKIVHPSGQIVAVGNQVAGIAYNTSLVPANKVPKTWDDCADPAFNGKKLWDVRPNPLVANWALWGEQKTLEYARRVAQGAAYVRGNTQAYTLLAAGEMAIYCGGNFGPFTRFKQGAATAPVEMSFPEGPLLGQPALEFGVLRGSPNQNAAILLLGWMSTEGLQFLKDTGRDSFFHPNSNLGQLAQRMGREVVVYDWSYWEQADKIQNRILQEWGFPKAVN